MRRKSSGSDPDSSASFQTLDLSTPRRRYDRSCVVFCGARHVKHVTKMYGTFYKQKTQQNN